MTYEPIIGLEIHIELNTRSKMFCSCPNDSNERHPNINICPICTAQPGTLPTINKEAVRKTIKTGLALNCQIPEYSQFYRKNYFYPDLPKGYQISQYDLPLCKNGFLRIGNKKIRIERIHLEEDTAKLIHPEKANYSLVDFNRAGVPLMELVTEPDLRSAQEAREFAQELHLLFHYLDVSDADMEKGEMRVEVNISLVPRVKSSKESSKMSAKVQNLGTKVEIKNLNSFRSVERAIEYEVKRQTEILSSGKKVVQETRGWDEKREITISQRKKEESHDYRYFPEPDLPPLYFNQDFINGIRAEIGELPRSKRKRFKKEYNLDEKSVGFFVYNKDLGEYFEKVMSELRQWIKEVEMKKEVKRDEFLRLTKLSANYIITDLQGILKGSSVVGEDFLITPENFAEFIKMIYKREISSKIAKMVLKEMFARGADPSHIVKEKGLTQITDEKEIEKIIREVITKNEKAVKDYKSGKGPALQFLVGQVMAFTKGKANPEIVQRLLKKILLE